MSNFKVVITDYEFATLKPEEEVLEQAGVEFVKTQCKTEEEVIEACKNADGILNQYAPITRKVIEKLENCKIISRYGVGVNTIDVDAATKYGIIVANVTDYCMDEVSDHALSLIMACTRKVTKLNNEVKAGNWDFKVGVPMYRLRGRTLGLVGFGKIPQTLALKAQALGLNIVTYDPFVNEETAKQLNTEIVDLNTLCERSDVISVHAPLVESTRGMISKQQFSRMKKEAFIVNTARGPVIDEEALVEALHDNEIAGAGLDVVEEEPISSDSELLKMDNVILNPHVAWYSQEAQVELKTKTAQNVADVLNGKYPTYLFNPAVKEAESVFVK
ncbi:C-terminal binding protein [Salibacterium salarium]|uniref:C-terminal binding protein n=1 Tax=Salibacterium salarium TaxID=284579 RepID=A0A3R9P8X0_9BACI|nr:C-terminal binding protein [Salibacterium salarium]RSL33964.1 C-terminal binding protein [Salibacterium salarium]